MSLIVLLCCLQAPAADPFDALASSLPTSDPVTPSQPSFTGPEVKEVTGQPLLVFFCGSLCRKIMVCCMDPVCLMCAACVSAWHHTWERSEVWRQRVHAASRLQIWKCGQFVTLSVSFFLLPFCARVILTWPGWQKGLERILFLLKPPTRSNLQNIFCYFQYYWAVLFYLQVFLVSLILSYYYPSAF